MLLASSYDQSRYLKAADLPAEKKFRIKSATEEEVGKNKERKLVIWFTNDKRGLVLNHINNRTIRSAYGDACDGWAGKIVAVFPTLAEYGGRMMPALRVRIPAPKGDEPKPPPVADPEVDDDDMNDEIGF
jgi:hypothetical protein